MQFPEQFRVKNAWPFSTKEGDNYGVFVIPGHKKRRLRIIATDGIDPDTDNDSGWEHVSVSVMDNASITPTWSEMCKIKDLFWKNTSCVVQFHPPSSVYVDNHPGCLHLWRSRLEDFPMPSKEYV